MRIDTICIVDYMEKKLEDLVNAIHACSKNVTFGDLRFKDFLEVKDTPHGVYVFFNSEGEVQYVGKASSTIFLGRLANHSDTRVTNWMSSFANKILKCDGNSATSEAYIAALTQVLNCKLLLICFEESAEKKKIARLEKALRSVLAPVRNATKHPENTNQSLNNLFANM